MLATPNQQQDGSYTFSESRLLRDTGFNANHPAYSLTAPEQSAIDQLFNLTLLRFQNNTDNCRSH